MFRPSIITVPTRYRLLIVRVASFSPRGGNLSPRRARGLNVAPADARVIVLSRTSASTSGAGRFYSSQPGKSVYSRGSRERLTPPTPSYHRDKNARLLLWIKDEISLTYRIFRLEYFLFDLRRIFLKPYIRMRLYFLDYIIMQFCELLYRIYHDNKLC